MTQAPQFIGEETTSLHALVHRIIPHLTISPVLTLFANSCMCVSLRTGARWTLCSPDPSQPTTVGFGQHGFYGAGLDEERRFAQEGWQRAWHGAKVEALYNNAYFGRLLESKSASRGEKVSAGRAQCILA